MIEQLISFKRLVLGILFSRTIKVAGSFLAIGISSTSAYMFKNQLIYHYFFSALTVLFLLSILKSLK